MFTGSEFFVDGSDEAVEDDWRLSDGRPLYMVWKNGEPAPCCKSYENCVLISRTGTSNDVPCTITMPFLCEKRSYDVI